MIHHYDIGISTRIYIINSSSVAVTVLSSADAFHTNSAFKSLRAAFVTFRIPNSIRKASWETTNKLIIQWVYNKNTLNTYQLTTSTKGNNRISP